MGDLKLLACILGIIFITLFVSAVWLSSALYKEAEEIRNASKCVETAFDDVSGEINKKLEHNNAIHYSDLVKIVLMVGNVNPNVNINIKKDYGDPRIDITIAAKGIKANYSLLPTIVEHSLPQLGATA